MMYHYEARILRIVQDANRNLSNTRFDDGAAVETEIKSRLQAIGVTPKSVTASVDFVYDSDLKKNRNNAVITEVVVPVSEIIMTPLYSSLFKSDITVTGIHIAETAEFDFFDSMALVSTP